MNSLRHRRRSSLRQYRLERMLKALKDRIGRGTELVSLYIPSGRQMADVMNNLREEYAAASNIKDRVTRHHVLDALTAIMQRLKPFKKAPQNGLIVFCGYIPKGAPGSEELEFHLIQPPQPISIYLYRCDARFHTEILEDMIVEKDVYGLLVMDRSEATFAALRGRSLEILEHIESGVPGKHDAGGQSQRRFERVIEQMAHEFYKRVGDYASKIFLNLPNFKGFIIGGPGPTKNDFMEGSYLHYTLKDKAIAIVDLGNVGEGGVYELIRKSRRKLREVRYVREARLIQLFLKYLAKDSSLVAYGENEVREALEKGAVKLLLLSEDMNKVRVVKKCQGCGFWKAVTIEASSLPGFKEERDLCPKCGLDLKLVKVKGLIDDLASLAKRKGAKVEVISRKTEEGESLKTSFGGVAAILRYGVG